MCYAYTISFERLSTSTVSGEFPSQKVQHMQHCFGDQMNMSANWANA